MWSTQVKQGPKGVNSLCSGYPHFSLLPVMDAATSLPQNLYFSLFYMPHATHTISTDVHMCNCHQRQGDQYPGTAGWSSRVPPSGRYTREQQPAVPKCQGVFTGKHSYRARNQAKCLVAFEIHHGKTTFVIIPFLRQNTVDHNRRNFHHLLQQSFQREKSHHIALPRCPSSIFCWCWSPFKVVHNSSHI